jgi:predicted ATPase
VDALGFTDNVVDFLVTTMGKLPENTLKIITVGSCFGNTFDIRHVAGATSTTLSQVENGIWQALRDGISPQQHILIFSGYINSITEFNFSFVHDRIQQAAYTMIGEEVSKKYHYAIGNEFPGIIGNEEAVYLKELMERESRDDLLFEVAQHFNKIPEFIVDPTQRVNLARLNLAVIIRDILFSFSRHAQKRENHLHINLRLCWQVLLQLFYRKMLGRHIKN